MKRTAGRWDPSAWPIYFLASTIDHIRMTREQSQHRLMTINDVKSDAQLQICVEFMDSGRDLFFDSGIFSLAAAHAAKHDMPLDRAIDMPLDQVDGFDELFACYVDICRRFGAKSWGYVELDLGGKEHKKHTRARCEALGLRPIPVYHALNDGWDYFDELAQQYDRICFGNIAMADQMTRKRLVATAWERRRHYPHLWIHLLGFKPSEFTAAFPANSMDATSWMNHHRFGGQRITTAASSLGMLRPGMNVPVGVGGDAYLKAMRTGAYEGTILSRTMRNMIADQRAEIGCDPGMFITTKTAKRAAMQRKPKTRKAS